MLLSAWSAAGTQNHKWFILVQSLMDQKRELEDLQILKFSFVLYWMNGDAWSLILVFLGRDIFWSNDEIKHLRYVFICQGKHTSL